MEVKSDNVNDIIGVKKEEEEKEEKINVNNNMKQKSIIIMTRHQIQMVQKDV